MKRSYNGALSGFGQVAQLAHAPVLRGHHTLSIVAVADSDEQRLTLARQIFPNVRLYSNLDDLLVGEPELDFIDIATPPSTHAAQAKLSLERGLHVLCEKPLTIDPQTLTNLIALAAHQNKALFTVHNWAYAPIWAEAIRRVGTGAIGAIHHMEIHVLRTAPAQAVKKDWRKDPALACGGILVDHGWHALYLLRRLIQAPPLGTSARLVYNDLGADTEATLFLKFPQASALLHLTWQAANRSNWALILGSQGFLELRDDILIENNQETRFDQKLSTGSAHPEWFAAMLDDFLEEMAHPGTSYNLGEVQFCTGTIDHVYKASRGVAV